MFHRCSLATLIGGAAILSSVGAGCGPSQDEYQAKVSEVASLKRQLEAEQAQNKKAKVELDAAASSIAELKDQLSAAGVDVSNLNANVEQQARALEDYRRRTEQIEQSKRRFDSLRKKLQPLGNVGLAVTTRNNRMVIELPGDVLFDTSREVLRKEGQELLLKVAEVIRNETGLAGRSFQVAGHAGGAPPKGGRVKDSLTVSLTRAREVLAFLIQPADKGGGGLDPTRWSASGHGDADPAKASAPPEGKQANRCELVVLPSVEEMLDLKGLTQ